MGRGGGGFVWLRRADGIWGRKFQKVREVRGVFSSDGDFFQGRRDSETQKNLGAASRPAGHPGKDWSGWGLTGRQTAGRFPRTGLAPKNRREKLLGTGSGLAWGTTVRT